jgi:hypothetical protein
MKKNITLNFGALDDSLEVQLKNENLIDSNMAKHEKIQKSILMLWFHGYISESQKEKMIMKLAKDINKYVSSIEKVEK